MGEPNFTSASEVVEAEARATGEWQPEVSIVIPIFNEAECLLLLMLALDRFLASFAMKTEVVLVDDGSTDGSRELLEGLVKGRRHFRLVALRTNRGQTLALAAGLEISRGDVIVFMDADLQNDPDDIPRLMEKLEEGFDLVSGWRRRRQDHAFTRRLPSVVANFLIGRVTGVRIHDYGCTLKAYRARILKPLHLYSDMHRFLPALCSRSGARIAEIEVRHHPRSLGSSKYGLSRIFKVLADLTVIKMIVTFADRPLHYFGLLSLVFLLLAGTATGFWLANLVKGWGEASVILPAVVLLFFCSFLYFLFMGLLADLIVRVRGRDPADRLPSTATEIS